MTIVDRGTGAPVVLIPGVQGRWEWMRPAVDALAARCRVITYSLADEPSSRWPVKKPVSFEAYVDQVSQVLDAAGLQQAVICGVSYGGLVAATFAARNPSRVSGLALVSALPPGWTPDARVRFFTRNPRVLLPLFLLGSLRLHREVAAATTGRWRGLWKSLRLAALALGHFPAPTRMAGRVNLIAGLVFPSPAEMRVPALIITGEPRLERVVPPALTAEYTRIWPQATTAVLERTGHLGLVTRPSAFADTLVPFVEACHRAELSRRRVG